MLYFLIYMTLSLFLAKYIIGALRLFQRENSYPQFLIPVFMYYFIIHPEPTLSRVTLLKLFLITWLMVRSFFTLKPLRSPATSHTVALAASAMAVFAIDNRWFPSPQLIGYGLIAAVALYIGVLYKAEKRDAFEFENAALLALGALLMLISKNTAGIDLGIGLIALHLTVDVIVHYRREKRAYDKLIARVEQLEERFERAVQLESKRQTIKLTDHMGEIHKKTLKDALTKAENREGLTKVLNAHLADPQVKICSIALFDIDHFKAINDTQGHIKGDETLKQLVSTILDDLNKAFTLGRYGGDEFVIIMPNTNTPKARELMADICKKIERTGITLSAGIATAPYDGRSQNELFSVADKGLYASKEKGRNQVQYLGNVPLVTLPTKSV